MNQQCKVCGEPAAGFHFGAFTCEGCKSFFGRTYNNLSSISECKNNGECVINKKNRTACKACRLRKCLYVGMSKSGSRYGRRSNWFKIHCLLQEQHQQHQQQQSSPPPPPPPSALSQSMQSPNHHHHHSLASQFNYLQSSHHQQQLHQSYQNNNKSPSPLKSSHPSSPCLLTNPFLTVGKHLLNGSNHCPDKIAGVNNRTNSNSSSDSGASSADPEDSIVSHKDIYGSPAIDSQLNTKMSAKKFDPARSISEPLNPYLMLPLVALSPAPPLSSPPSSLMTGGTVTDIQDEPIDLSVKSQKRCQTCSPKSIIVDGVPKLTPLDLTLVRTNTLSG